MRLSPASVAAPSAARPEAAPVPRDPKVPSEILELVDQPLFRGEYTATERDTWWQGMPLVGTKVSSERTIGFSNEFNLLRSRRGPFAGYAASSFDDAVHQARELAFDWSDPAFGGKIYASVGVAVLQASDGLYYMALVGSGDPNTTSSALGYRSDRFDEDIHGELKQATDARAVGPWSAPLDKDGRPVDVPAPDAARGIRLRDVVDHEVVRFTSSVPALKALVDLHHVFEVEQTA